MSEDNKKLKKELEDIEGNINQLSDDLEGMVNQLNSIPKIEGFDGLEQTIEQLKTAIPSMTDITAEEKIKDNKQSIVPPVDGETCMHGNSWHSNCADCSVLDDLEIIVLEISNMIENEPNDAELGRKIRDFHNIWNEHHSDDTTNTVD